MKFVNIFTILIFIPYFLNSQYLAKVSGYVTDSKGKAIVGAKISITSPDKKDFIEETSTNEAGFYEISLPDLDKTYIITVKKDGFLENSQNINFKEKSSILQDIVLNKGINSKENDENLKSTEIQNNLAGKEKQSFQLSETIEEAKSPGQIGQEEVTTSAPSFQPETSPYFTYNIFNVVSLVKDVKYSRDATLDVVYELEKDYFNRGPLYRTPDAEKKYYRYVIKIEGPNDINWEALEKWISPGITEEGRKKYLKAGMEVAEPVPVNDIFEAYAKAKKMEITDAVFSGIKWPELTEGRELFRLVDDAHDAYSPNKVIPFAHYRVGGAKLDLRAGQDVIAPPAAIVFDFERGPFFRSTPWRMSEYNKEAWTDRKFAYLKVGPLYIEFDEWGTYDLISGMKGYGEYFASGRGLYPLLKPNIFPLVDYLKDYYNTLYPSVRKAFDDMKFVRIFSIQMFKDSPNIRAYAVMVPPGVLAGVRDSPEDEVQGYNYVKDTVAELDKISGKQPNIKETCIREEGRNPDEYGFWNTEGRVAGLNSPEGGLFIVYPTKVDGSEWTAELVATSIARYERVGIGGVFPSTFIEEDGHNGQIYYDQTAPTHWKALMDGNPGLIIEDYRNALSRAHFDFSSGGMLQFKKDENGNIRLVKRYTNEIWYPKEIENEMKDMVKKCEEEDKKKNEAIKEEKQKPQNSKPKEDKKEKKKM